MHDLAVHPTCEAATEKRRGAVGSACAVLTMDLNSPKNSSDARPRGRRGGQVANSARDSCDHDGPNQLRVGLVV
jgi:hypothetical protein